MKPSDNNNVVSKILRDKSIRRVLTVAVCLVLLAGLVVVGALPGEGFTTEEKTLTCSFTEVHQHTDDCYVQYAEKTYMICGESGLVIHAHNKDDCFDENGTQVCSLPAVNPEKVHTHTDECFAETEELVINPATKKPVLKCTEEQNVPHVHGPECYTPVSGTTEGTGGEKSEPETAPEQHRHDGGCYTEKVVRLSLVPKYDHEEHVHDDSCYTYTTAQSSETICSQQEHEHNNGCRRLICEIEDHLINNEEHSDACYEFTCGLEEHAHVPSCYDSEEDRVLNCEREHTHIRYRITSAEDLKDLYYGNWNDLAADCDFVLPDKYLTKLVTYGPEFITDWLEDSCYKLEVEWDEVLTCGEGAEGNTYGEDGYGYTLSLSGQENGEGGEEPGAPDTRTPICGKEEGDIHIHSGACYYTRRVLDSEKCGLVQEHTHNDQCYTTVSLGEDGTEVKVLTCELPQVETHDHGEGCFTMVEKKDETPENNPPREIVPGQPLPLLREDVTYKVFWIDDNGAWQEINAENLKDHLGKERIGVKVQIKKNDSLDLSVDTLQQCGKKISHQLPPYFTLVDTTTGTIKDGLNKPAGTITCDTNNTVTLEFEDSFLADDQAELDDLQFSVQGYFNLEQFFGEPGFEDIFGLPAVTIDENKDKFLAKNSSVDLKKEVVTKGGSALQTDEKGDYFVEYTLTVKAGRYGYPDVDVKDYIIAGGATTPDERQYWQERWLGREDGTIYYCDDENFKVEGGRYVSVVDEESGEETLTWQDATMTWHIGKMEAKEERTLTYRVYLNKDYVDKNTNYTMPNTANLLSMDEVVPDVAKTAYAQIDAKVEMTKNNHVEKNDDGGATITYWIHLKAPEANHHDLDLVLDDVLSVKERKDDFDLMDYLSFVGNAGETENEDAGETENGSVSASEGEFLVYSGNVDGKSLAEIAGLDLDPLGEADGIFIQKPAACGDALRIRIDDLEPGKEITIVYRVKVDSEAFKLYNDNFEVYNKVNLNTQQMDNDTVITNKHVSDKNSTATVEGKRWVRKLKGERQNTGTTVKFGQGEAVFETYNAATESWIRAENPTVDGFEVKEGYYRYQVIINDGGIWNVNSWKMTDELQDKVHMQYAGYMEVKGTLKGANGTETEKTVWLKIDGQDTFNFNAYNLGYHEDGWEFTLNYYAKPVNVDDRLRVVVANSFTAHPGTGGEDGIVVVPDISYEVNQSILGNLVINSAKQSWYYAPNDSWNNGALYWVLRVRASRIPTNIQLQDRIGGDNKNHKLYDTSVVDAFIYDEIIDFEGNFDNYAQFKAKLSELKEHGADILQEEYYKAGASSDGNTLDIRFLKELKLNDPTGQNSAVQDPGENPDGNQEANQTEEGQTEGVQTEGGQTEDNQTGEDPAEENQVEDPRYLYFVIKTEPRDGTLPEDIRMPAKYMNDLYITDMAGNSGADGGNTTGGIKDSDWRKEDSDFLTMAGPEGVSKFYDGRFYTNGEGVITDKRGGSPGEEDLTEAPDVIATEYDDGSGEFKNLEAGLYVTWLVEANIYGDLKGTYELVDTIPEGMELKSVALTKITNQDKEKDKKRAPQPVDITDGSDLGWTGHAAPAINGVNYDGWDTLRYYTQGNRVKWRVEWEHFGTENKDMSSSYAYKVTFLLTCYVTDDDVRMGGGEDSTANSTTFTNNVEIFRLTDDGRRLDAGKAHDDAAIPHDAQLVKSMDSDGETSELVFTIEVNPLGQKLADGETITIVDKMSELLKLDYDEIHVYRDQARTVELENWKKENENPLITVEDGKTVMQITLPDGEPLYVVYKVKINAVGDEFVSFSNDVNFQGRQVTPGNHLKPEKFWYAASASAITSETELRVSKRSASTHPLSDVTFVLTSVEWKDGEYVDIPGTSENFYAEESTKTTDQTGDVVYKKVKRGVIYRLEETVAPNGYLRSAPYYFIFPSAADRSNLSKFDGYRDLNIINEPLSYYKLYFPNYRGKIEGKKLFLDANGSTMSVDALPKGDYLFGLYTMEDEKLTPVIRGNMPYTSGFRIEGGEQPDLTFQFVDLDPGVYYIYELYKGPNDTEYKLIGSDAWKKESESSDEEGESWRRDNMVFVTQYDYDTSEGIHLYVNDEETLSRVVTVTNTVIESYKLPRTGGKGIPPALYAAGGLMVIGAGVLLVLKKRTAKHS